MIQPSTATSPSPALRVNMTETPSDLIDAAYDRYVRGNGQRKSIEVWKFNRQIPKAAAGKLLRIQASSPFLLRWTSDEWQQAIDTRSRSTAVGIDFVDIPLPAQKALLRFAFLWVEEDRWEGGDYKIEVQALTAEQVRRVA